MISKKFILMNAHGLHARAADKFVKQTLRFSSTITLIYGKKKINAKSIMNVLTLEAGHRSEIEICINGDDEEHAMRALETLITNDFDET